MVDLIPFGDSVSLGKSEFDSFGLKGRVGELLAKRESSVGL